VVRRVHAERADIGRNDHNYYVDHYCHHDNYHDHFYYNDDIDQLFDYFDEYYKHIYLNHHYYNDDIEYYIDNPGGMCNARELQPMR
jgi:hypothetical protein